MGQDQYDPPLRALPARRSLDRQGAARPLAYADLSGSTHHDGIAAPCVIDGPINGASLRAYIEQFLVPTLNPGDVVVMYNLGSHKGQAVRRLIRSAGAKLFFLPRYSPDLSIRSNKSSPSSRPCCAKPIPAPSRPAGATSATCSAISPRPNVPITSPMLDTLQPNRITPLVLPTALTYAAGIRQELNEWESLTDAPARPLPQAEQGRHRPIPWGDSFVPCSLVQSPDSSRAMLFDAPVTFTP